jgi:hypothetical protein
MQESAVVYLFRPFLRDSLFAVNLTFYKPTMQNAGSFWYGSCQSLPRPKVRLQRLPWQNLAGN